LSRVAYTVPLRRNGATSIRGPADSANGDDTRFGALAWRDQPSGETPMSQRCARKTNTA
jgi:hypothetical protein